MVRGMEAIRLSGGVVPPVEVETHRSIPQFLNYLAAEFPEHFGPVEEQEDHEDEEEEEEAFIDEEVDEAVQTSNSLLAVIPAIGRGKRLREQALAETEEETEDASATSEVEVTVNQDLSLSPLSGNYLSILFLNIYSISKYLF